MSYSEKIHSQVGKLIGNFIRDISQTYDLNPDELHKIWHGNSSGSPKKENIINIDMEDLSPVRLHKCTLVELKALCRKHGHKVSGKKAELIERLSGTTAEEVKIAKPKSSVKTNNKNIMKTDVAKAYIPNITALPIRKNEHGNYAHPETNMVFDRKTAKVIGKQNDDGTIDDLDDDDIQTCKRFKFDYEIPENLDGVNDDVNIEGIDDVDEDSESEVELIEEEIEDSDNEDSDVLVETDDEE